MLLMRVALPNRPGSLGAVATALGSIGAQINLVEIVEKRHDVEIDEFILELPTSQSVGSIVETCDALAGVQVDWIRNYARGGNIELDIQLRQRMAADPQHAAETFVTAAPVVFRAQWALLLDVTIPCVSLSTPSAPRLDARSLMQISPVRQGASGGAGGWLAAGLAHVQCGGRSDRDSARRSWSAAAATRLSSRRRWCGWNTSSGPSVMPATSTMLRWSPAGPRPRIATPWLIRSTAAASRR